MLEHLIATMIKPGGLLCPNTISLASRRSGAICGSKSASLHDGRCHSQKPISNFSRYPQPVFYKSLPQMGRTEIVWYALEQWSCPEVEVAVNRANASRCQIFQVLPRKILPQVVCVRPCARNWPGRSKNPLEVFFCPNGPEKSRWRQDRYFRWIVTSEFLGQMN